MRVVVVGGGISGLAAAWRLQRAGAEVVLLEAGERTGGKIRTERTDGWLVEHGPNGFLSSRTAVLDLAKDVGLEAALMPADDAAEHRYLFVGGRLRAVPHSPPKFMKSNLLSLRGRMRLAAEPLIPRRTDPSDESVRAFAARRIGPEAADKLVDPMVTGIYAGDVSQLSLRAAFPKLHALESEHGSLVRGMLAKKRSGGPAGPGGRLTSFEGGMSALTDRLAADLDVQTGRRATGLARHDGRWRVAAEGGDPVDGDAVVVSTPADAIAGLVGPLVPAATAPLEAIPYAPAAVVAVGYRTADLPRPLDGFGFLVPSGEGRRVLGVVWSSSLFADRAPDGHALLRVIVGGARHPELLQLDDEALVAVVREELGITLGRLPDPAFAQVVRWPRAIPQYTLGHLDRVRDAEGAVATLGGVHLAGNGLYGVSLADCVARADALPDLVLGQR